MRVLTRSDVRRLVDMRALIDAVEAAHAALADGAARQGAELPTAIGTGAAVMLPMTAALDRPPVAGVKVFADVPDNPDRGLRRQHSAITILDAATGQCRGFMDGVEVTLHRTAAATAVATRRLARADATTLGLIGTGAQARSHLEALTLVRDFERVTVWNRTRARAERFAAEHPHVPIEVLDSPEAVVRSADVLCTLTPSREPLVRGAWFRRGQHVNAVGAPPRPDHREIDSEGIARSMLVVDDRDAALSRSGDVCVAISEGAIQPTHVHADLGEIATGRRPGRTSPDQITLFNSIGLPIQDLATASLLLDAAAASGAGVELDLLS